MKQSLGVGDDDRAGRVLEIRHNITAGLARAGRANDEIIVVEPGRSRVVRDGDAGGEVADFHDEWCAGSDIFVWCVFHCYYNLLMTREEVAKVISEVTGKSLKEIYRVTKDDRFFSAKEALEFGIATKEVKA